MRCQFSETQFAFCYVFELIAKYPKLMPLFPNTVQEGRKGGGYDVEIDGSLFLQFKIPEYLTRDKKYKIKIDTKIGKKEHNQFTLLKELKRNKPANIVYYCAPKFHEEEKLRELYHAQGIENNSAHFPIEQFPDNGKHHNLKYEYEYEYELDQDGKSIEIINTKEPNTFGLLYSKPIKISSYSDVFSIGYQPDPMPLKRKANILIKEIVNKTKYIPYNNNIINDVDWLFSVLLLHYNILWIPIKSNEEKNHALSCNCPNS